MLKKESKRGFAGLSPERLREITSSGGKARKEAFDLSRSNEQLQKERGRGAEAASLPPKV